METIIETTVSVQVRVTNVDLVNESRQVHVPGVCYCVVGMYTECVDHKYKIITLKYC